MNFSSCFSQSNIFVAISDAFIESGQGNSLCRLAPDRGSFLRQAAINLVLARLCVGKLGASVIRLQMKRGGVMQEYFSSYYKQYAVQPDLAVLHKAVTGAGQGVRHDQARGLRRNDLVCFCFASWYSAGF